MITPTQRSLKVYKDRETLAEVVEKWVPYTKIKRDVFGFGDVLVADPIQGKISLVQVTSGVNHNARVEKILSLPTSKIWLQSGGEIVVMSFKKLINGRYEIKEQFITLEDIYEKENKKTTSEERS